LVACSVARDAFKGVSARLGGIDREGGRPGGDKIFRESAVDFHINGRIVCPNGGGGDSPLLLVGGAD